MMKVIWLPQVQEGKRQIANYIHRKFGFKRKKKFMQEVDQTVRMLMRVPQLGSIDPLYADRPTAYRSIIINGLNKMIYRIDDNIIYIADFWDTRCEPENQAKKTR